MSADRRPGTGTLLRFGIVVGPFYLAVGLAQALSRDGFDLGRHSLSALANGSWGWVQSANFVLSGLMVIAAAVAIGRVLRPHSKVAGWILSVFGIGMLVAAIFPADPVDGFPVGTPEGMPETVSTEGMIHFMAGGLGFLALALSCIAVGVAMVRRRERWVAGLSFFSGFAVVGGFMAPAIVPASGPVAGIWFSVVVGWAWLAFISAHLHRGVNDASTQPAHTRSTPPTT